MAARARAGGGQGEGGKRHRARRPHELEREERERREEEEFRRRGEEARRLDRQRTVQVGSIVTVADREGGGTNGGQKKREEDARWRDGPGRRRAVVVKTGGVPGLNRILIRYEGTTDETSVRKGDVVLVGQAELDEAPFSFATSPHSEEGLVAVNRDGQGAIGDDSYGHGDRERIRHRQHSSDCDRDRDRGGKDEGRRDRDRDRDRERNRSRDQERDQDYDRERNRERNRKRNRKRSRREDGRSVGHRSEPATWCSESTTRWLTANIRVRVITKKLSKGRQYKEKGTVLDILPGQSHATVQMADGEILDMVPDRYLETALPKVGGCAIILAGDPQYVHSKGRLLERNSDRGRGVVQLSEDMSVLTLSLDDIAEWVGPLDEDL